MFWWGIQPGYIEDLRANPDIELFQNEKSALYYMGFNVRKAPFNDANLRRAVATLVDEDFIIKRILQGYGIRMYSIVPPGNAFWYCPESPDTGKGSTERRVSRRPSGSFVTQVTPGRSHLLTTQERWSTGRGLSSLMGSPWRSSPY